MLYFEDLKIDLSESSKPTLLAPTPEVEISRKSIRFLARLEADLRSQLGLEMIQAHSQGAWYMKLDRVDESEAARRH